MDQRVSDLERSALIFDNTDYYITYCTRIASIPVCFVCIESDISCVAFQFPL